MFLYIVASWENIGTENLKRGKAQTSWKVVTKKKESSNTIEQKAAQVHTTLSFYMLYDRGVDMNGKGGLCFAGWLEHNSMQAQIKKTNVANMDFRKDPYNARNCSWRKGWSE